jgi:hypothetical protein
VQPWQPVQPPQQQWTPQPVPGAVPAPTTEDYDLAALSPFWPKVAAAMTALGGLCAILGSLQTWMTVDILSAMAVLPVVDFLLGVAAIGVATRLAVGRRWAAIVGLALSGLLVLGSGVWMVYALSNGFVAVFVLLAPVMSLAGSGLCAASLGPCDRAERARERLASQGLELGL